MNYENLKFAVEKTECDNFKQKQVTILRNVLEGGRLIWDMKFSTFAIITFDEEDTKHLYPHIQEIEDYNRLHTNCMIYDLFKTDANRGFYDKLIIYQTNGAKGNGYFGYFLYNSETKEFVNKFYVDRTEDELARQLHKSFNLMRFRERYEPYK